MNNTPLYEEVKRRFQQKIRRCSGDGEEDFETGASLRERALDDADTVAHEVTVLFGGDLGLAPETEDLGRFDLGELARDLAEATPRALDSPQNAAQLGALGRDIASGLGEPEEDFEQVVVAVAVGAVCLDHQLVAVLGLLGVGAEVGVEAE